MQEKDATQWLVNSQEKKQDYIYILEQEELAREDLEKEKERWSFNS